MSRLMAAARFALAEFGPLIVFWTLAATLGVKPAILGSILFIVADAAWRWRKGLKFTRLYLLVSGLTLIFGLIDLASTSPFMLKYEAVITNAATGLAFVAGALGEKPIIQEVAEQRGETFVATQEVRAFFRLFTLVWAAYFFLKAALLPLDGLDAADARGDGAALRCRKRQSRPDDRCQRDAGPAALLPLPPPRPLAQARRPRRSAGASPASQT